MISLGMLGDVLVLALSVQQALARPPLRRSDTAKTNSTQQTLTKVQAGYYPNWYDIAIFKHSLSLLTCLRAIYEENFRELSSFVLYLQEKLNFEKSPRISCRQY